MIRISGVNIPQNKIIFVALTYIYGIGLSRSINICKLSKVNPYTRVYNLDKFSIINIRRNIHTLYSIEGDLRSNIHLNIKNLIDINTYRGLRHIKKLPVRGQRTHTNARTRKRKRSSLSMNKNI